MGISYKAYYIVVLFLPPAGMEEIIMPEWIYIIIGIACVVGFIVYIAADDARGEVPENHTQTSVKTSRRR